MQNLDGKENRTILYVDDRTNNLSSFKAIFRREFNVLLAESAVEAIQIMEEADVKVVISDYKMPNISGVMFLESVKNNFPDTVRIMLTGHANLPAVVEAINKSEIFRFLAKPWSEPELRNAIYSAIDLYDTRKLLFQRNEELNKAYNELDRLVYSTAHDITGPLSNILGLLDIIRSDSENSDEYLDLIEKTTKKLQIIARDVLSFHRNKRTGLRLQSVNMEALIHSVLEDHQYYQNIESLKFNLEIEQDFPLNSDRTRIRFILNNLISNAIKYQDPTKADNWVNIRFKNTKDKGILTVEDNGVGIAKELLPKIFGIYFRASNQSTGTGIGLYITTEAANLIDGKVEAESEKGVGTTFTVSIPNLEKASKD